MHILKIYRPNRWSRWHVKIIFKYYDETLGAETTKLMHDWKFFRYKTAYLNAWAAYGISYEAQYDLSTKIRKVQEVNG